MPKYTSETLAYREKQKALYKKLAIEFLEKQGCGTSLEIFRYIQGKVKHPQSQLLWSCIKGSNAYKFTQEFMYYNKKERKFYLHKQ